MNNSKKIALAVAILCSAGTTMAQEVNPSWYIQPNVIVAKPDGDFGVNDRDWGGGLKFGKAVSPMWDIQFGASQVRFEDGPARYRQTLLGADALLMFSRERFRPFVLVGLGLERDKVQNPLRNVGKNSPYLTAGIGFQASLTPQWSFQADLRSVRGFLRDHEQFGFRRSNNKYLTLGLNYAFNPPPVAAAPAPAPAPVVEAPAPAPAPVAPPPPPARFEKVTLEATKLFEFDKSDIIMPSPKLDEIAAALMADTSITDVDITGHTDRLGSEKYNLKLSERRANAVRDYLVSKGVDGNRLKAYGKGESNPLVQCTEKNRKALIDCLEPNRRVEVEQITVEKRVQ
ncbi:OmpA family protein [Massilia yuzhufengensis]|uniref:OmpA-OmpF porin, OOP family n=1 Tax=Massilia yuzhufengensis TaxID=1164594 RepID=A0A1I1F056_9BURK|nr:OmpA family protein [Massilia yuzhufengensis]SFB92775.1 OmpA-OmpF porin, OOP family [Massilia yuzhufengensis]